MGRRTLVRYASGVVLAALILLLVLVKLMGTESALK